MMLSFVFVVVFAINFGILNDVSKAFIYASVELLIVGVIIFISIGIFLWSVNTLEEFKTKKAKLDALESKEFIPVVQVV